MKRFLLVIGWIASLVIAYILGDYFGFKDTVTASTSYGRFLGNPKTEWLDERDMKMLEDFIYIDPSDTPWLVTCPLHPSPRLERESNRWA